MLVKCSDIMSEHNVKLAGHIQNLVGQCPMTDCYFQPSMRSVSFTDRERKELRYFISL